MANTALTICGTGADDGDTSAVWQNPSNITDDDSDYAEVTTGVTSGKNTSNYLKATNFGFSLPAGTTSIDGIEASIKMYGVAPANSDTNIYLIKAGTVQTGWTNKGTSVPINAGTETRTYGGSTDTWGASPALAYSDINNSGFGVGFRVTIVTAPINDKITDVYFVKVTVYYTATETATFIPRISFYGIAALVGLINLNLAQSIKNLADKLFLFKKSQTCYAKCVA